MLIENNVREATNDSPSIAFVNHLIDFWISPDQLNAGINTTKKLFAQAQFLPFIPDIALSNI